MSQVNLFELAARNAFRFETSKGYVTVEDLFQLPLDSEKGASLNQAAKTIARQLKQAEEESFVSVKTSKDNELEQKLDIVKHIIAVRMEENAKQREAVERKQKREKIATALIELEDKELKSKSADELRAMLNELSN
jgi:hypothetical protein